jgi:valyl-tRNA synthetase
VSLCVAPWPKSESAWLDPEAEIQLGFIQEVITAVRTIRGEMGVPLDMRVDIRIEHRDEERRNLLIRSRAEILALTTGASVQVSETIHPPSFASTHTGEGMTIYVLLPEKLRVAERARLEKELQRVEKGIESIGKKLSLESFLAQGAPPPLSRRKRRSWRCWKQRPTASARSSARSVAKLDKVIASGDR